MPPIFGRLVDAQEAGIAQLLEDLVGGEDAVLFPFVDMRIDVLVDDGTQRAADLGVFLGELHGAPNDCPSRGMRAHQLGDDLQHDLVGAAADRAEAAVAVAARHRTVPEVAGAAPVLQAGVRDLAAQAAGLQLGHRGQHGDVGAGEIVSQAR